MIGRLNHIAIAVPDLDKASELYRSVMGAKVSAPKAQPAHGVTVVFVELPNTKIEALPRSAALPTDTPAQIELGRLLFFEARGGGDARRRGLRSRVRLRIGRSRIVTRCQDGHDRQRHRRCVDQPCVADDSGGPRR